MEKSEILTILEKLPSSIEGHCTGCGTPLQVKTQIQILSNKKISYKLKAEFCSIKCEQKTIELFDGKFINPINPLYLKDFKLYYRQLDF